MFLQLSRNIFQDLVADRIRDERSFVIIKAEWTGGDVIFSHPGQFVYFLPFRPFLMHLQMRTNNISINRARAEEDDEVITWNPH